MGPEVFCATCRFSLASCARVCDYESSDNGGIEMTRQAYKSWVDAALAAVDQARSDGTSRFVSKMGAEFYVDRSQIGAQLLSHELWVFDPTDTDEDVMKAYIAQENV